MAGLPWVPATFGAAFPVAILALACWGSWSVTAKAAARLPFAYCYVDFSIAVALTAAVAFLSLGGYQLLSAQPGEPPPDGISGGRILAAVAAGLVFNVANLLLTVAVQVAGLSVAFPIGIGTALVLGTVLTYLIDSKGDPALLFPGVLLAFIAVLFNAAAHFLQDRRKGGAAITASARVEGDRQTEHLLTVEDRVVAPPKPLSRVAKVGLCVVSGLLMSLWSPLSALSMKASGSLTAYSSFLFFALAVPASTPLLLWLQRRGLLIPRVGAFHPTVRGYSGMHLSQHGWGLLGGAVWSLGTLANLISGDTIGLALSYAVGQSAPMVATLWGLFYYWEFKGAPRSALACLALMFLFYGGAVAVISVGG